MSSITTDDRTSLYYEDWGEREPVVFVHCWSLNADVWEYQMAHLTDCGLRCVAYDRRGQTLRIQTSAGLLSFFSTRTLFGTPIDVTLSEIAPESFFPADAATVETVQRLERARMAPARPVADAG